MLDNDGPETAKLSENCAYALPPHTILQTSHIFQQQSFGLVDPHNTQHVPYQLASVVMMVAMQATNVVAIFGDNLLSMKASRLPIVV